MKKLMLLALAMVIMLTIPAFAEVQNVKVGGDINAKFVQMANLDLDDTVGNTTANNSSDHYFTTTTKVYVSADLTDNVKTYIRLINERDWDSQDNIGDRNLSGASDVSVDLSYIKLSEFLYSPLTLTIGRQEIWWGSALLVGTGNTTTAVTSTLRNGYLTPQLAFDSVRATLNYDPWTIDMFWARIDEDENDTVAVTGSNEEDEDLVGLNLSYVWPSEWLTEAYYVGSFDSDITVSPLASEVHSVGIRAEGKVTPLDEKLYLESELAYQWGEYNSSTDLKAWAGILGLTYSFENKFKPVLGLKYDFRSGNDVTDTDNEYEGWTAPYSYNLVGHIIDKVWLRNMNQINVTDPRGSTGNLHAITTSSSFCPIEDIKLSLDWVWARADEEQLVGEDKEIGNEFIGKITYDYTEDVKFSVLGSYFLPEEAFRVNENDDAYEIISSVAVEF